MRLGTPPNDERKLPARPFRDSAILYGVLALVVVLIASLTGGGIVRALVIAVVFFVLATGWSWWRLRARVREEARR